MSVLTRAQDHIFIKLRTVNNIPGTTIPAVVRLEEDEDLVFDPSQWYIGVAEFRASLGSSSLVYKLADEDATPIKRVGGAVTQPSRAVVYTELEEQHGRFASGRTKQQEVRTLDVPTYSLAGLLEHLNPQTPDISASFSMGEDGRIILEKPHDQQATTCTEVTLSQDLCDEFDLDDADIARVRSSNRGVDQLIDVLNWYVGLFEQFTPLMSFASHCVTSNAPRAAATLRGLDLQTGLHNAIQTLTVTLPNEYFDANGIKRTAVIESDMVPGMCELAVHHFVHRPDVNAQGQLVAECRLLCEARNWRIAYNTTHNEWRLESSECEWYFPTKGQERVIIEDPVLRVVAAIYQFFLTPSYTGKVGMQANQLTGNVTLNDEDWVDQQNRRLAALKNASVFKDQQATARLAGRFMVRQLSGNRVDRPVHDHFRYQTNFRTLTSGRLSSTTAREFVDLDRVQRAVDTGGAPTHEVNARIKGNQTDPTFRDRVGTQRRVGELTFAQKLTVLQNRFGDLVNTQEFLFEFNEPLTHSDTSDKFLSDTRVTQQVAYQRMLDFQGVNGVHGTEVSDTLDNNNNHVDHFGGSREVGVIGQINDFEPTDYVFDVRARLFERAYSVRRPLSAADDLDLSRLNLFDGTHNAEYATLSASLNAVNRIRFAEVHHDAYIRSRAALQRTVIVENQLRPQIAHVARYYETDAPLFAQEFGGKIQNSVFQFVTSVFDTTTVGGVFQTTAGIEVPLTVPVGGLQKITPELLEEANAFQREYLIPSAEMRCYPSPGNRIQSYVELHINDAQVAAALSLIDFEDRHVNVSIRQVGAVRELKGRVLRFGKRFVVLDAVNQTHTFESTNCLIVELRQEDVGRINPQDTSFPTAGVVRNYTAGDNTTVTLNVIEPRRNILFKIDWSDDSIQGQLENQGIKHLRIKPEVPFRMCAGDKVKSLVPNSDSLQKYTSMGLVSTDGFLFKSTHFEQFKAPLLIEVPILNDVRVQASKVFKTEGLSYSNTGDVYYTANGQYALHQLMTNIPLRTGSIRLQLSSRDGTETKDCELAFRGVFEVKLVLIRK